MGKNRKRKAQEAPSVTRAPKKQHKESKPATTVSTTSKGPQALFVEEPRGAELKHEVELYEKLSSSDETERLEAADAVVSRLLGWDGVSETCLTRHLERRLFRGLASGRKAARLGFSVVLTEVLSQLLGEKELSRTRYPGLTFDKVLGVLKAKTRPEGDLSGQEERDHAFGLLFGLQCFVRAKLLSLGGKPIEEEKGRWEEIFENLLKLAKKKPWVREECGWVIVEALGQMQQRQAENTLKKLQEAGLAATPEGVGVWLTARELFPTMKFPSRPWGENGNPLEHLSALAKVLKESSTASDKENGESAQQTGNWHPHLHFVWEKVLHECIQSEVRGLDDSTVAHFVDFWKVAVDESLFSSSASTERKFWGFLLFQKALKDVSHYPWLLSSLFSQNFMRCLINHISHEDRFLHRAADRCIKSLLQVAEKYPDIIPTVVPRLITDNGVYNFDQVTKTRTVDKLLSQLQGNFAHEHIIRELLSPIKLITSAESARDAESRRQVFGDYIIAMIRRANTAHGPEENAWIESQALPHLASMAYSKIEAFTPPISERTRNIFRNRLHSALAHMIVSPNGFQYPCKLIKSLKSSAVDMDGNILAAKDRALGVMAKLLKRSKKAAEDEKRPLQALAMLYALVIFQLYDGEPDAVSLIDELEVCYEKVIYGNESLESGVNASVALVEILLSFMSKQSMLLRKIAQQVFSAFSGGFDEESLKLLVDVLESSENLKGQQELFDHADDELEHSESDQEMDSDVEVLDIDLINGRDESNVTTEDEEDDDDSNENEDEEESIEDDVEAQKLDDALAAALGTHRADQDINGESSDSDADMSDSEMMELDSKLIEIFSQRKKQPNKKQEKKDARENIINFKIRVLDLLEIYVKEQAASLLAFGLLPPLLKVIRTTSAKQISERAHNVITVFAKASKGLKLGEGSTTYDDRKLQVLKNIHEEGSKDQSHAFTKAASTASLLVATSLFRATKSNRQEIAKIYHETEDRWAEGKVKMQASFFHDWVNWCQSHVS